MDTPIYIDTDTLLLSGKRRYGRRAVDHEGNLLYILAHSQRNKGAAKKLFCKLLKGHEYVPQVIITDKLGSDGAAKREVLPGVEHRQGR